MFGVSVELMNLELGCTVKRFIGSGLLSTWLFDDDGEGIRENHVVSLEGSI